MRRQSKAATVLAQPNLFHMWNKEARAQRSEGEDIDASIAHSSQSFAEVTAEAEVRTRSCAAAGSISLPIQVDDLATGGGTVQNMDSLRLFDPVKSGTLGHEKENLTSDHCASKVIQEVLRGSRPPKLKPSGSGIPKDKQQAPNGGSQKQLFPIFKQKDDQRERTSETEAESSDGKREMLDRRTRKTEKIAIRSSRLKSIKRTASEHHSPLISYIVDDGILAGPSSSPRDITESTTDRSVRPSFLAAPTGSQEEPIVIDSSPVKDTSGHYDLESSPSPIKPRPSVRGEASTGFFAPRKLYSSLPLSNPRRKVGEGEFPKWPGKDSQHIRGPQNSFSGTSLGFTPLRPKPRTEDPSTPLSDSIRYLCLNEASRPLNEPKYLVEPVGSQADGHARCESILQSKATCPAITRFLSADYDISGSSWNERWRPRSADEVIGNETSSRYLRDWLLALEIRTDGQAPVRDTGAASTNPIKVTERASRVSKRPQVIRTVDRPRKRRKGAESDEESLDDWITSDDDEEEEGDTTLLPYTCIEDAAESSPDDTERWSPWKPRLTHLSRRRSYDRGDSDMQTNEKVPRVSTLAHDFSGRLTNTVLLSGPSGSGKTAAVYACAEELGWEVFEVYPGIGKRNGSSLLSLVGDVGKNHIVNRSSRGVSNTHEKDVLGPSVARQASAESRENGRKLGPSAFASFFSHESKDPVRTVLQESAGSEQSFAQLTNRESSQGPQVAGFCSSLESSVVNGLASAQTQILESKRIGAQQSIILLEEVDILFGEDINFWPTVVALIRESRRPVIMTCNDPSLVPSPILPLQTTLPFTPCLPDLANSYLQCMALVEGYAVSDAHVRSLYERGHLPDVPDISDSPAQSSAYPSTSPPDLRRAINSLQFLCQGSPGFDDTFSPDRSDAAHRDPAIVNADFVSDDLCSWEWTEHFAPDFSGTFNEQTESHGNKTLGISKLHRISDSLSMIDSHLARSSLLTVEMDNYATGRPSDKELGYPCLEDEPDVEHLQGGIVVYNHDEAIASEALACARRAIGDTAARRGTDLIREDRTEERWKRSSKEVLLNSSRHYARVSGILKKIVPAGFIQSAGALMLDYEPWVRWIDRTDMLLEAAAVKETETRTVGRGGRTTRNSQRMAYQRYFNFEEEERKIWQESGFSESIESIDD